jgi:hypothetical protein
MRNGWVLVIILAVLAGCSGQGRERDEAERYFETYRKIVRFTYQNIDKEEVVKEGVDAILKEDGYTMESFNQAGEDLLAQDKEYFIKKVDEINRQFAEEKK